MLMVFAFVSCLVAPNESKINENKESNAYHIYQADNQNINSTIFTLDSSDFSNQIDISSNYFSKQYFEFVAITFNEKQLEFYSSIKNYFLFLRPPPASMIQNLTIS